MLWNSREENPWQFIAVFLVVLWGAQMNFLNKYNVKKINYEQIK